MAAAATTSLSPKQPRRTSESSAAQRKMDIVENPRMEQQRLLVESSLASFYYSPRTRPREEWGPWRPPDDTLSSETMQYFRKLDQLHPCYPSKCPNGNVALSLDVLNVSNMDDNTGTADIAFECIVQWVPLIPEFMVPKAPHGPPTERVLVPDVEGRQFRNLIKSCHEYMWSAQVALADADAPGGFERQHHLSKWDWDPRITTPGKSVPIFRLHQKFNGTVRFVSHPSLFPFDNPEIRLCFRSRKWTTSVWRFLDINESLQKEVEATCKRNLSKMTEWRFKGCRFEHREKLDSPVSSFEGSDEYDTITVALVFRRRWSFWFVRYLLPLDLVVAFGWAPFFVQANSAIEKLVQALFQMGAVVALICLATSLNSVAPQTPVATLLDMHYLACFIVLFLSLAAIMNVPATVWPRLAKLKPPAPHAKLAIVFAAWHIALFIYVFLTPFLFRRRTRPKKADRSSTTGSSSKTA